MEKCGENALQYGVLLQREIKLYFTSLEYPPESFSSVRADSSLSAPPPLNLHPSVSPPESSLNLKALLHTKFLIKFYYFLIVEVREERLLCSDNG